MRWISAVSSALTTPSASAIARMPASTCVRVSADSAFASAPARRSASAMRASCCGLAL
jgi:hypothetical protein